ncbi:MAG TPA: transglutaminase family protein [Steroidobacteraceae bacterium]|nr:transglutaminase family protein [Steroidobacteraceae bacterium]
MGEVFRYRVMHETIYRYSSPVVISRQIAHLTPRETSWQKVHSHRLEVSPQPVERSEGVDYFGNPTARIVVDTPHDELIVRAESEVTVMGHSPEAGAASPAWESVLAVPGVWNRGTNLDVEQYRVESTAVPLLATTREYAASSYTKQRPWLEATLDLTRRIRSEFHYDTKATTVTTQVEEVLELKRGVCQDFAHLMISCLRSLGLPARYVSGYVLNRRKAGKDTMSGADASHAWVASHCPAHGWVAFDPTNGKIADTEFVTLGWGRDYHDVSPLRGVVRGTAAQELAVAVSVVPVEDAANV